MSGTLLKIDKIIENKRKISFRKYNRILRDLTYLDLPYSRWFDIVKKTDYIRDNLTEKRKTRLAKKAKKKVQKEVSKQRANKITITL